MFITTAAFRGMMSLLLATSLPQDNEPEELKASTQWRVILGAPLPFQVASILSMIFYVKYDSIRFLTFTGRFNEAREMIKQVYDASERPNRILDYIEVSSRKETSTVTLRECFEKLEYKRATIVGLGIIIFHEMTG